MGCVLAIDYGLKRIGVAVSDPERIFAFPCKVVENKNLKFVLEEIKNLILEKEVDLVVVGIPYQRSEKRNSMEETVNEFIEKLSKEISVSIEKVDESYTSFIANENLKECNISARNSKKLVDAEAARLILEEFLNKTK